MRNDIKYWLGISKIRGVGAIRFKKIYEYFPDMQAAWGAGMDELIKARLERSVAENILEERREIDVDGEMEKLDREDVRMVTILDEAYPRLLKEIYNPPAVLYYKGRLDDERDKYILGIVGTRNFSDYGRQVVDKIVGEVAEMKVVSVSGLALGIDTLVHNVTVNKGGRTIAVLGSGLDRQNIYPSINRYLADKIAGSGGLILSEYPIGTMPLKEHFPQRNRIIAGLSLATLVIEAPARSGALITTQFAVEFNRDVLAVPGNIENENSAGTNNLIKLGARAVTSAADVLEVLNFENNKGELEIKKLF